MNIKSTLLILALGLFLTSCNRDRTAPVIEITSPANNLVISAGLTFTFQAKITDDEALSEINFTDGFTTIDIFDFDAADAHRLNYNITVDPASDPQELTLTVTATDLAGNTGTEEVVVIIE